MPNKYEYPDDTKSTPDGEKEAAKEMEENSLSMAHLYQAVDTSNGARCLTKMCSEELPKKLNIQHGFCYMKGFPNQTHCLRWS